MLKFIDFPPHTKVPKYSKYEELALKKKKFSFQAQEIFSFLIDDQRGNKGITKIFSKTNKGDKLISISSGKGKLDIIHHLI